MLKTFNKVSLLALSLMSVAAMPSLTWAQSSAAGASAVSAVATTPDQAVQTPAGKFVQDLGDHAISIIADKSLSQQQRTAKYSDILHSAFDLKTIGHFVIGRAYDTAPPDQQQEYMKLFEQLVIKMYGDRLNFYSGEKFHVKAVRQESEKDMVVNSEITHADGSQATTVDWRVRQRDGQLAIIDVMIAGVSQSVTQRQEYGSIVQRDGGKLDNLLVQMRQQVQAPSTNSTN